MSSAAPIEMTALGSNSLPISLSGSEPLTGPPGAATTGGAGSRRSLSRIETSGASAARARPTTTHNVP
jgi:hypothetical protein